ncbi:hypothetical protein FBU31_007273, partial [Coemansia sp. 'formosensis']
KVANQVVPAMFIAYSTMIIGGIFAACAHTAPTAEQRGRFARCTAFLKEMCRDCSKKSLLFRNALVEIECVEEMVGFLPRRLDCTQLLRIRELLIPRSIEGAVGKRFSTFITPIRHIARMPPTTNACSAGTIPLTSNLCAIFGKKPTQVKEPPANGEGDAKLPDYKLTYTAISTLLVAMSTATKDESFFAAMLGRLDTDGEQKDEVMTSPPSTAQCRSPSSDASSSAAGSSSHRGAMRLQAHPLIRGGSERLPPIDDKTIPNSSWLLSGKVDALNIRSRSADADLHQAQKNEEEDSGSSQKSKLLNLLN